MIGTKSKQCQKSEPIPNGWRKIHGYPFACLFLDGYPVCGRPSRLRLSEPISVYRGDAANVPNCPACDQINDGLWYIDAIDRAEEALEDRLSPEKGGVS